MKLLIFFFLATILGVTCAQMGFSSTDWEFWFILLIANAYYVVGTMKGASK